MKKLSLLLLTLTVCFFTACHKDIWAELENLDQRVTKLEELCKEMNTNITSLQTIVSVLQSNDFITGIVEIKKNGEVIGYTITFGKHDPITIYHGQDGKDGADGKDGQDGQNGSANAPVIGVAQDTDGVYYWTLNGEWLLDDNGNKLPVSGKDGQNGTNGSNGQDGADGEDGKDGTDGQDGKDGITPQLKIEDGYWYISYDNGATWTQLGKATGEDGQDGKDGADGADGKDGQNGADGKDGQDGDSMFQSVTQDDNYVYFTLADGTVIKIAKGSGGNDQLNDTDFIKFEDLAVKSMLLRKKALNTNGDLEISYQEASEYAGEISLVNDNSIRFFSEMKYFDNITSCRFYQCSLLVAVELPKQLSFMPEFYGCTKLVSTNIPDSVKIIGANIFYNCSTLVAISIPESVTKIDKRAFYNCSSMTSITIPKNITFIGETAFGGCSLDLIWDAINCKDFKSDSLPGFHNVKSITFGENVEHIPAYICRNNDMIKSITIPDNVKSIGSNAFDGCDAITSISIGNNLTSIGSSSFQYCSSVQSVTFPETLSTIGSYAFSGCNKLTTIKIPKNVTEIGSYAFTDSNSQYYGPNKIYCEAINPPVINGRPFKRDAVIYVPRASVDEYRVIWSDYADRIVGYDFE